MPCDTESDDDDRPLSAVAARVEHEMQVERQKADEPAVAPAAASGELTWARVPQVKMIGGKLHANCTKKQCSKGEFQPAGNFVEYSHSGEGNSSNCRRVAAMRRAIEEAEQRLEAGDVAGSEGACARVSELRTNNCAHCRKIARSSANRPTTLQGRCTQKENELKARMKAMGCARCGSKLALDFNHFDPAEKARHVLGKKSKPLGLFDGACHWKNAFGEQAPDKMEREFTLGEPNCVNCHRMDRNGKQMRPRLGEPGFVDTGARDNARNRRDKYAVVDARKLAKGKCEMEGCNVRVVPRGSPWVPGESYWPHCFDAAHRDELDWGCRVSLVAGDSRPLKACRKELEDELPRTRMFCANHHRVETAYRNAHGPGAELDAEALAEAETSWTFTPTETPYERPRSTKRGKGATQEESNIYVTEHARRNRKKRKVGLDASYEQAAGLYKDLGLGAELPKTWYTKDKRADGGYVQSATKFANKLPELLKRARVALREP